MANDRVLPLMIIHVLLIEDDSHDIALIREFLKNGNTPTTTFELIVSQTLAEGLQKIEKEKIDIILADLLLPDSQGLETFYQLLQKTLSIPIVILTGLDDEHLALEAVQKGAQDYLVLGKINDSSLWRVIRYSLARNAVQQTKEEFINIITHELRTPLTIIRTAIDNLVKGVENPSHVIRIANKNVSRLMKISDNLLTLARLEKKSTPLIQEAIDLIPMLQEISQDFEIISRKKDITVETKFPKTLPPIQVDPQLIYQTLSNLLYNALRFTKDKIKIEAKVIPKGIQISIGDNGEGIDPKNQSKLFSKYYQVGRKSKKEEYQGAGLGLAICKEIVEAHGGEIWVESQIGEGSLFHFTLRKSKN